MHGARGADRGDRRAGHRAGPRRGRSGEVRARRPRTGPVEAGLDRRDRGARAGSWLRPFGGRLRIAADRGPRRVGEELRVARGRIGPDRQRGEPRLGGPEGVGPGCPPWGGEGAALPGGGPGRARDRKPRRPRCPVRAGPVGRLARDRGASVGAPRPRRGARGGPRVAARPVRRRRRRWEPPPPRASGGHRPREPRLGR